MAGAGVVILGAGQGGFQTAASLRDAGFSGPIRLVGDEPELPYQRPPLSKSYLAGETGADTVTLRPPSFYAHHEIDLIGGERVGAIERQNRRVVLASGATLGYDHLVLATGTRPRLLPVPHARSERMAYLRTLADATALRERLASAASIVLVGAGFIGLEVAAVAAKLGKSVTILEATARVMARVVSPPVAAFFAAAHARWGARLAFGTTVARVLDENCDGVEIETTRGERLRADLVVICIGVVPNDELAVAAGLAKSDGVVVDENLLTADPAISAVGDCARYPNRFAGCPGIARLESVQNAVDQARCVAARLAGRPAPYHAVPWFWSDQNDLRLQIAGLTTNQDRAVVRGDTESGVFSVFCYRHERLVGIESVNRPADHIAARKILAAALDLAPEQAADPDYDLRAHAARRHPAHSR